LRAAVRKLEKQSVSERRKDGETRRWREQEMSSVVRKKFTKRKRLRRRAATMKFWRQSARRLGMAKSESGEDDVEPSPLYMRGSSWAKNRSAHVSSAGGAPRGDEVHVILGRPHGRPHGSNAA
jgi:hypothetical protein